MCCCLACMRWTHTFMTHGYTIQTQTKFIIYHIRYNHHDEKFWIYSLAKTCRLINIRAQMIQLLTKTKAEIKTLHLYQNSDLMISFKSVTQLIRSTVRHIDKLMRSQWIYKIYKLWRFTLKNLLLPTPLLHMSQYKGYMQGCVMWNCPHQYRISKTAAVSNQSFKNDTCTFLSYNCAICMTWCIHETFRLFFFLQRSIAEIFVFSHKQISKENQSSK